MSKVTMPEPVACLWIRDGSVVNAFAHTPNLKEGDQLSEYFAEKGFAEEPLITTTQAEAYADARVREALEEAARRIELLRDSHCADTALGRAKDACTPDGSNCDIVSAWNDSIEIVRALIPPTE